MDLRCQHFYSCFHILLANPPTGRGLQRFASCPSFQLTMTVIYVFLYHRWSAQCLEIGQDEFRKANLQGLGKLEPEKNGPNKNSMGDTSPLTGCLQKTKTKRNRHPTLPHHALVQTVRGTRKRGSPKHAHTHTHTHIISAATPYFVIAVLRACVTFIYIHTENE